MSRRVRTCKGCRANHTEQYLNSSGMICELGKSVFKVKDTEYEIKPRGHTCTQKSTTYDELTWNIELNKICE